jgi:hypothetical protein
MTARPLLAWLAAREPAPPPALRAYLEAAASDAPPRASLPEQLAALGQRALARVTARVDGGRELALDLLAADAFVTYAFEAQAETDVMELGALAERVGRGAA